MKLPLPTLQARSCAGLSFLTDEALFGACGVRMGFTRRGGGASLPPYDSLNLGSHVGDDLEAVRENRRRLLDAAGLGGTRLLMANQVHGSSVLSVDDGFDEKLDRVAAQADAGADGLAVGVPGVTALLCFADCVPVVVVSASGAFAVAHAGWRGAFADIPRKAVEALRALDADRGGDGSPFRYNAYIGPHIMAECYQCDPDLVSQFVERFGPECAWDGDHLSLDAAVRASLLGAGVAAERIVSAGVCTACSTEDYYSYRASGGVCGRHGAFAGRKE